MSYVKNYNVGQLKLDLPTTNYIYELPLFSFSDIYGGVNLTLVYNNTLKQEGNNTFRIAAGYKLNVQKRIIISNNIPTAFQNEAGKLINLNEFNSSYTFDDDSQRIIRRNSSIYELENPDFSKEYYDSEGKIIYSHNKYGELMLSYSYDLNNKLESITYRNNKIISLAYYDNNCLSSISYGGKTIGIVYSGIITRINHYSGTTTSITLEGTKLTAKTNAVEDSKLFSYSTVLEKRNDTYYSITNLVNNYIVDEVKYKFYGTVVNNKFAMVEVIDNKGVRRRTQYEGDTPRYSYELVDVTNDSEYSNAFFDEMDGRYAFKGSVISNNKRFGGVQKLNDGIKMTRSTSGSSVWNHSFPNSSDLYGYFILSGWIWCQADEYSIDLIVEGYNNNINPISDEDKKQTIRNVSVGEYNYFSVPVYLYNPRDVKVIVNSVVSGDENPASCIDLRLTFVEGKIYTYASMNHYTTEEDVLIVNNKVVPFTDVLGFYNGSVLLNDVTFNDVLKYRLNKHNGVHTNEIYYNNCRGITQKINNLSFTYNDVDTGTVTSFSVDNIDIGKKYIKNDKTYLTKTYFTNSGTASRQILSVIQVNDTVIGCERIDKYFDIISNTVNGITTEYNRSNGLIIGEGVPNLYTKNISYDVDDNNDDKITVRFLDANGTSTTVYTMDSVWGYEKSITQLDDTVITNEYDDGMYALKKKTFGENGPSILFDYLGGNLSGIQSGNLTYDFTYSKDKLSTVFKNDIQLEEHNHTDSVTSSYYPSQNNSDHQHTVIYDKYNRVSSYDDISYIYKANHDFDDNGNLQGSLDNSDSVLAMSTDSKANTVSRYEYDTNNRLIKKTMTGSSFDDSISEENLTYDDISRVASHEYKYDPIGEETENNKKIIIYDNAVKGEIVYRKSDSDHDADNTVAGYSYKINDSLILSSVNAFDTFDRITNKDVAFGQNTFSKNFVYSGTKLRAVENKLTTTDIGTNSYTYDSMGRISSVNYLSPNVNNKKTDYNYDSLGRLVRENNETLDKTFIYCYDNIGNITGVEEYAYSEGGLPESANKVVSYGYNTTYPDRLTNFNGKSINYDTLGRVSYYDGKSYNWSEGRLSSFGCGSASQGGALYDNCIFTYDGYGRRTRKQHIYDVNPGATSDYSYTETRDYTYDNSGRLIREYYTNQFTYSGAGAPTTKEFIFLYDESGIVGVRYINNGASTTDYYYVKNQQGDVTAIVDTNGNLITEYAYDAYGNCTVIYGNSSEISRINPIRYRSYYYDTDTGLYYINARYYNPQWRRFISPETAIALNTQSANGLNLYSYANNNPIGIAYSSSSVGGTLSGGMDSSLALGVLSGIGNNHGYSNQFNIFAGLNWPQLYFGDLIKDASISLGEVGYRIAWSLTENGRAFLDFHYSAYGINGYTALDNLPSTSANIFKGIGISLMALDVIEAGYYSYQNGHSFCQGTLNISLTTVKNILVYKASTGVAMAVGTWAGAKLGVSLGSAAGPVGFAIGAIVGAAAGWVIDGFGDVIIDWVVGWFG